LDIKVIDMIMGPCSDMTYNQHLQLTFI